MLSKLRQVASAVSSEAFRGGARTAALTGVRVVACVIAANELHDHAAKIIGELKAELLDGPAQPDESRDSVTSAPEPSPAEMYALGMANGACQAWLHASEHYGRRVPSWVLTEIQRLGEIGEWRGPAVYIPAQHGEADDVDEGQAQEAELVDEDQAAGDAG